MYKLMNINFKNKILDLYKTSFKMNVQDIVAYNKINREYTHIANNRFNIVRYINHNDNDLYILNHLHRYIEKFTITFNKYKDEYWSEDYIFNTDYIKHLSYEFENKSNKFYIIFEILGKQYKITNLVANPLIGNPMTVIADTLKKKSLIISSV